MTSAADQVVDGFADELEKLAFPAQLEKLALFGWGKPKPPPTTEFGKLLHKGMSTPVGKVLGRVGKMVFSKPAFLAFGAYGGMKSMGKGSLNARLRKNMGQA